MSNKFNKERKLVLDAAQSGIKGNIKLSSAQKKYVKNLLLFALMNASGNQTVTNKNFIKLVNKLFKTSLIKIIKEALDDDDDDTDFDGALEVELNKIIADKNLINLSDLQEILTPENITSFLKGATKGLSQKDLVNKLLALREAKANHRETPQEQKEREQRRKEYELQRQRDNMMNSRTIGRGQKEM